VSQALVAQRAVAVETERIAAGHTVEVEVFVFHFLLLSFKCFSLNNRYPLVRLRLRIFNGKVTIHRVQNKRNSFFFMPRKSNLRDSKVTKNISNLQLFYPLLEQILC
jgi:hypothetical protein